MKEETKRFLYRQGIGVSLPWGCTSRVEKMAHKKAVDRNFIVSVALVAVTILIAYFLGEFDK